MDLRVQQLTLKQGDILTYLGEANVITGSLKVGEGSRSVSVRVM